MNPSKSRLIKLALLPCLFALGFGVDYWLNPFPQVKQETSPTEFALVEPYLKSPETGLILIARSKEELLPEFFGFTKLKDVTELDFELQAAPGSILGQADYEQTQTVSLHHSWAKTLPFKILDGTPLKRGTYHLTLKAHPTGEILASRQFEIGIQSLPHFYERLTFAQSELAHQAKQEAIEIRQILDSFQAQIQEAHVGTNPSPEWLRFQDQLLQKINSTLNDPERPGLVFRKLFKDLVSADQLLRTTPLTDEEMNAAKKKVQQVRGELWRSPLGSAPIGD